MARPRFQPHHQAVRDTMWVGKGVGPVWAVIAAVLMLAGLLAYWLN